MFAINDDLSINITRGDIGVFTVDAVDEAGEKYLFQKGDVVRIKVTEKKACENVMFQKDFVVEEETEQVELLLTEDETKIGEVISKPTDYWYEIELNPLTNPQTIIGYDEDGAKIFKLYPEGKDVEPSEDITPEDIPIIDEELDLTSDRPVQNHVIAKAFLNIQEEIAKINVNTGLDNIVSKEDLKTLESDIATNTSNIEDLSSTVDEHTEEIATLKDVIGYTDTEETIAENIGKIKSDVAGVQTQIDNLFSGVKLWTPSNVKAISSSREYYVKTRDKLSIWYSIQLGSELSSTNKKIVICDDIKSTFGVLNNHYSSWDIGYTTSGKTYIVSAHNNQLALEFTNDTILTSDALYGCIEMGIH